MSDENEKIMEEIRTMCLEILESQKALAKVPKMLDHMSNTLRQIESDIEEIKALAESRGIRFDDYEGRITSFSSTL